MRFSERRSAPSLSLDDRLLIMSRIRRKYLLYIAAFQAAFMAVLLCYVYREAYDVPMRRLYACAVSLAVAVVWSLPLWLPAVIPARLILFSRVVRWTCALLQLIYIWQFSDFIRNQV